MGIAEILFCVLVVLKVSDNPMERLIDSTTKKSNE